VIKPLADIAFKAFGFTNLAIRVKDNDGEATNVQMVGLYSATVIRVRHLLAFANTSVRFESGEIYAGASAKSKIDVVKLLSMNIAIRNTTPVSDKQGNWAAFLRLVKSGTMATFKGAYTYKSILEFPGARSATAREDLKIVIPRFLSYWKCGRDMDLDDVIGILFVGFEDLNRKDYGDFTAGDFSCSVTEGCDMLVLNTKPGNYMNTFTYALDDGYGHTHQ
jgi:hypothetical protein